MMHVYMCHAICIAILCLVSTFANGRPIAPDSAEAVVSLVVYYAIP